MTDSVSYDTISIKIKRNRVIVRNVDKPDGKTCDMLRKLFLFRDIDESVFIRAVSGCGFHINNYISGEVIYNAAKYEKSLGFILSGSVVIATADSTKKTLLKTLGPGEVFGAASLFGNDAEYVTQIIAKNATTAAFFTQSSISEIIASDSRAAINYIHFLSDRIRFLNNKILAFTSGNAETRLARFIEKLPETDGIVTLPFGLTQLADSLDIGRASLYRAFDTLVLTGCIKRNGKKITVLSRKLLSGFKQT